jgi:hypothetical protein
LPAEIKVRFIKTILPSGEVEVLLTSLLAQDKFKEEDFLSSPHF